VEDKHVLTIEGLSEKGKLDALQQAFIDEGAIQCGFCTPGMIMSAKALLNRNDHPLEEEVRRALAGNLCRCTGYAKIIKAILKVQR
jgi:carbon-monoxide dehydrogenase small subunit